MRVTTKTTRKGAIAAFGRRAVNQVVREAFAAAGEEWAVEYVDKHFTAAGAKEYGYRARYGRNARPGSKIFAKYAGKAEREAGAMLPNVWSGETRRNARTFRVVARATSKLAYAHIRLPKTQTLNRLPAKYRGELHIVSRREWRALVHLINKKIKEGLDGLTATERHGS